MSVIDDKYTAVALLYGPPKPNFNWRRASFVVPLEFRMALEQVFDPEEVKRVGLRFFAADYYEWYVRQEHNHDQHPT